MEDMNIYEASMIIEGVPEILERYPENPTEEEQEDLYIEAYQYLYDSAFINSLPGKYQRECQELIDQGFVKTSIPEGSEPEDEEQDCFTVDSKDTRR